MSALDAVLERIFVPVIQGELPPEMMNPREDTKGTTFQANWSYSCSRIGERATVDLVINISTSDEPSKVHGRLIIRSVWDPKQHEPQEILDGIAVFHLQQKAAESVNGLLAEMSLGPVEVSPAFFVYSPENNE